MANANSDTNVSNTANIYSRVSVIETKVDMFIQEMRDRDNQRAAEIQALRAETNAKFTQIENKLDDMSKSVSNIAVAATAGIGAISVAVIGFIVSIVVK